MKEPDYIVKCVECWHIQKYPVEQTKAPICDKCKGAMIIVNPKTKK